MSPARKQLYTAGSVLDKAKLWDLRASQEDTYHPTGKPEGANKDRRISWETLLSDFDTAPPAAIPV